MLSQHCALHLVAKDTDLKRVVFMVSVNFNLLSTLHFSGANLLLIVFQYNYINFLEYIYFIPCLSKIYNVNAGY